MYWSLEAWQVRTDLTETNILENYGKSYLEKANTQWRRSRYEQIVSLY
jgi:hypothetical protein